MYIYILIIIIILIIALLSAWFAKKKKQGICPICLIKQYTKKSKLTIKIPNEFYSGGNADTPPMGWSSWNTFRNNIDEKLIIDTAAAMSETGLLEAGYEYINLDDCWHSSLRDENGKLQGDLVRFPSGIGELTRKINAMGFKLGLYTSNGEYTCEDLPASLGYEKIDAETFSDWGAEYFKYDFCHNVKIPSVAPLVEKVQLWNGEKEILLTADDAELSGLARICIDKRLKTGKYISFLGQGKGSAEFEFESEFVGKCIMTLFVRKTGKYDKYLIVDINGLPTELFIPSTDGWTAEGRYQLNVEINKGKNIIKLFNPVCTRADSAYIQYKRMGEALKNAGKNKKITYSICEWGRNKPAQWAWNAGNLWRTTPDIRPNWKWITIIYNENLKLGKYAGAGHWNDPDMLEVGNGNLTYEENKTHFSLWCMMASPLILGNDIRKLTDKNSNNNVLEILKNQQMIAINQDSLGHQCVRYKKTKFFDFLVKKLKNDNFAICIFNKNKGQKTVEFNLSDIPNEYIKTEKTMMEIWSQKVIKGAKNSFDIPGHGCLVFIGNN